MEQTTWVNESLQTNIQMYYTARYTFDRFHYSNLYTYARAIIQYVPAESEKEKRKLLDELQDFYEHPLEFYYTVYRKKHFYRLKLPEVSFARIEYVVYKYTVMGLQGRTTLSKPIYLTGKKDVELSELIDLAENFKRAIHEKLTDYLIKNKISITVEMPNMAFGFGQVGFGAKRN